MNEQLTLYVKGYSVDVIVTLYHRVPPDYTTWASDLDYYGYTDVEFSIQKVCDGGTGNKLTDFQLSLLQATDFEEKLEVVVLETLDKGRNSY